MRTFICWMLSKLKGIAGLGLIGALCLLLGWDNIDSNSVIPILMIAIPVDIVLSVWAGVFTYKNFDEVFSRSSRWRNSNVTKFDMRFKYSVLVFFQSLFAFPILLGTIGLIVYFIIVLI